MKKKQVLKQLLTAAALVALTAACSNDPDTDGLTPGTDPTPDSTDGIPVAIHFGGGMGPETRTTYDPTADGGFIVKWLGYAADNKNRADQVGISAMQHTADGTLAEVTGAKNVRYYATQSGVSSPFEPYGDALTGCTAGNTYTFYSYRPYSSSATAYNQVGTETLRLQYQSRPNSTDDLSKLDLTYAAVTNVPAGEGTEPLTVNFQYRHALSMLQFELTNNLSESLKVQAIRLARQDGAREIITSGTLSLADGSFPKQSKDYYQELKVTSPSAMSSGATQKFYMMIFPGYAEQELELMVTTDQGTYTLGKTAPAGKGFEAGQTYKVALTLTANPAGEKESWIPCNDNGALLIASENDLLWLARHVNSGYTGLNATLSDDITLSEGAWLPIGTNFNAYTGTFDGNGKTITFRTTTPNGTQCEGLFGQLGYDAKVKNLTVAGTINGTFPQAAYIGGIVAKNTGGSITNCASTVTMTVNRDSSLDCGGIAGTNGSDCTISQCYASGKITVEATGPVGGICGTNNGSITDCYTTGDISHTATYGSAGGISGDNSATITRCYARGTVDETYGYARAGGIAGKSTSSITHCAAINAKISAYTGNSKTAAIAYKEKGTISDCIRRASLPADTGVTEKTDDELLTADTYTALDWDFTTVWGIDTDHLPYLLHTPGSKDNAPTLPAAD